MRKIRNKKLAGNKGKKEAGTIVISLGGSLIVPKKIDFDYLKRFKKFSLGLVKKGFRLIIVCGGGSLAGEYISAGKEVSKIGKTDQDMLGIYATRLNAQLVKGMFGKQAFKNIIEDPTCSIKTKKKIIIAAGWKPGFSTDMDAVILAEKTGAGTVINLSNIRFVYDKDPARYKDAVSYDELSWKEYLSFLPKSWTPRLNSPFDPIASRKAKKSNISVAVINGKDLDSVKRLIEGKRFTGTIIR